MQEMWVQSLVWKGPLEREMATHSSIAWETPWTEEPGGLQSLGSQRVGYNLTIKQQPQQTVSGQQGRNQSYPGITGGPKSLLKYSQHFIYLKTHSQVTDTIKMAINIFHIFSRCFLPLCRN